VSVLTVLPGYVATPLTEKNPYQMPFLLQPDEFARRAVRVIERKCSYAVIPWQMGIVAKLMRMLPNPLFDKLFAGKKYKPRADVLNADSANTQVTTHKDSENSPP
jgi:short-subunit dehydrogenase